MADIRISQLDTATAYTLNDVVAIVDSGFTVTKKIDIGDLLKSSGQIPSSGIIINSGINAGDVQITNGNRHTIISARGATISDNENSFIAGTYPGAGTSKPTIEGGGNTNSIISAYNYSRIYGSSFMSSIIADENSKIQGGYTNFIAGSNNVQLGVYAGGGYKITSLGSGNGSIDAATESTVIASRDFSAHLQGSNTMSMISSKQPVIEHVSPNAEVTSIFNSKTSSLYVNAHNNCIINSDSVSIDDRTSSATKNGLIINGWGGGIVGNNLGSNYQKALINTYGTQITHGGSRVVAINSNGGTISATGDHNMLINTESKDITGSRNKATVIGVWDNTQPVDYENTVYLGAIHNYGARSAKVIDAGNVSGTVDVDGSLGEAFIFTLTGNTQPNFINLREGQKFVFSIYNNGGNSVTGGTINGVGGNVLAKGGNISPSNNAWSFYTGFYDGTRLYLIEENGLSSI